MSTNGYTDCVEGTFYGFTDTENNEFYPGQSLNLQWGLIQNGTMPLNISLGRVGGALVDNIVSDATFSETSSLYQIVANTTANCTLEQYSWAIPTDFNTSNPEYQIGLFDGGAIRGDNNNGWRAWSPVFYVRDKTSAVSASRTATTTGLLTATAETSPSNTATSSSSASTSSSSSNHNTGSSNSTAIGVGVGVGVGCAALIALGAFWFIWRRRKARVAKDSFGPDTSGSAELPGSGRHPSELPVAARDSTGARVGEVLDKPQELEGGKIVAKASPVHEME
ncbi:hypothetical protein N7456_012914 [Penicillium angulare]|uniref:Peptidase A1 domain-containing protein n=1 Tax=Penicillium angulare TaxID=116970 RepID=A0A9W9EKG9_9EURO|nr:hypothetical protein N7456_012914 [Penicillium angulare]